MRTREVVSAGLVLLVSATNALTQQTTKYVRYTQGSAPTYGVLEDSTIHELAGDLFSNPRPTGRRVKLAEVELLAPVEPGKVIAVGLNYKTHLGERPAAKYPGLFLKLPSSIIPTNSAIVIPVGAQNVHYEGEMVIVIGKRAREVKREDAKSYIFGVTIGNDVSERDWQKSDLQWFRAKASDTFGPLGPAIVTGLNYDDLLLQTRLNGEVVQSQRTKDLIFDVAYIVSYVSHYVTLMPGDVIFTGTPGTTRRIDNRDVVEVELEGVGVLRNPVSFAYSRSDGGGISVARNDRVSLEYVREEWARADTPDSVRLAAVVIRKGQPGWSDSTVKNRTSSDGRKITVRGREFRLPTRDSVLVVLVDRFDGVGGEPTFDVVVLSAKAERDFAGGATAGSDKDSFVRWTMERHQRWDQLLQSHPRVRRFMGPKP